MRTSLCAVFSLHFKKHRNRVLYRKTSAFSKAKDQCASRNRFVRHLSGLPSVFGVVHPGYPLGDMSKHSQPGLSHQVSDLQPGDTVSVSVLTEECYLIADSTVHTCNIYKALKAVQEILVWQDIA